MLDYLPMWHPSDGQIYFWRIVPLGNMRYTIGIYRIAPDGTEPELVRDLTTDFAAKIPLFQYEALFLDGISAISPDGNTVATLMTNVTEMGSHRTKPVDDRSDGRSGGAAATGRPGRFPQRPARMGPGLPAPGAGALVDGGRRGHRGRGQHRVEPPASRSRSIIMSMQRVARSRRWSTSAGWKTWTATPSRRPAANCPGASTRRGRRRSRPRGQAADDQRPGRYGGALHRAAAANGRLAHGLGQL